jgi:hypothetical protein
LAKRWLKRRKNTAVTAFAEDLGRFLGTAEAKAETWLNQRKDIIDQLTAVRDKAASLIHALSGENPFPWKAKRKKTGPVAKALQVASYLGDKVKPKRKRKSSWTAAQRKAVGDRMRKYWAARRAVKKRK